MNLAPFDAVWTLTLFAVLVLMPALLALVGYGVVRLAVRHELARADRRRSAARTQVS